jgi:hypothetical protein
MWYLSSPLKKEKEKLKSVTQTEEKGQEIEQEPHICNGTIEEYLWLWTCGV